MLCVRVKSDEAKERVIKAIRGTVLPEGNPVTFWIATDAPVEDVRQLPDVEDAIVSGG